MKRRLAATATSLILSGGAFAGLSALTAAPAHADGVYLCLKPVSTTVYYPNGQPVATASAYQPDGVSTTPNSCPAGDIAVGG